MNEKNSDNLKIILTRNEFYQNLYHSMLLIVILTLLAIILLLGFIKIKANRQVIPKYFPTTQDGKIIQSPDLTKNHLLLTNYKFNANDELIDWPEIQKKYLDLTSVDSNEHAILIFWCKKAVIDIFNLDFINYRATLQGIREYFTAQGYERFIKAFKESKNLDTVKEGKRVAFAEIAGQPKVVATEILQGRKVWKIEMPITITYEIPKAEPFVQKLNATIKVCRTSTLQNRFYGLAIYQINFKVM